ncbi:MAG: DUF1304 family protein [Treponema sp.]|nr:DUF1304 family protein [Treponema sp.]
MSIIIKVCASLVALEFFFIMYLETFATTSEWTAKVFGMERDELRRSSVSLLFKNQGVYNGVLAVLVLVAVFAFANKAAVIALMISIIAVSAYGAVTTNPKILPMQGGLAAVTLVTCFLLQ